MNGRTVESSNGEATSQEAEQKCMGLSCCSQRSPPPRPKIVDRGISNPWNPARQEQGEVQQGKMPMAIQSNQGLKDVLRQAKQPNSKLVVLEFMAPWSEPCKFMRPAMEEIAARFKEHADFYTLDVEQFKTFARNTRVEALPTFLLVRDTILQRVVGVSKDDLQRSIEKHTTNIVVDRTNESI
ncbi:hypothetical protein SEVIR_4G008400v4 [Setaria viridis]|uniref:Thioredoxin domain-containing protein n=1 Tax=Setaria viridis TaxID=4556 RepID=A0A4U6UY94_SETVI|nr:thioredoxin H-type 2-like [Setaria viridis]TKW19249.1 hypothetical protein SEVIR_4G008400v2 [Setaria viridis]